MISTVMRLFLFHCRRKSHMSNKKQAQRSVQGDRSTSRRIRELETMLQQNAVAVTEGPAKKTWYKTDMKVIRPKTQNQGLAFDFWYGSDDRHLALLGSAGTGKSFLAVAVGILDVIDPTTPQKKLVIVRSLAQGRQVGALPGTLEEKAGPTFSIYKSLFAELFGKADTLMNMVDAGLVELVDTSHIRGATWNNAIVFVDEITSMNDHEVDTVMTRIGEDSRVIIGGDQKQSDLVISANKADKHNYQKFLATIERMPSIDIVKFTHDDIVRSGFVRDWIIASDSV